MLWKLVIDMISGTPYGRGDKRKVSKRLLAALNLATQSPRAEGSWRLVRAMALKQQLI